MYLVSRKDNVDSLFALKKIKCPFGSNDETYKNAIKEIKNYHRFANCKSPYIIQSLDEAIINENDGSITIYILLPYFEVSLQDIINYNVLNERKMEEAEIIRTLVGVCRGLQTLHKYRTTSRIREATIGEEEEEEDVLLPLDEDEDEDVENISDGTELSEMLPFAHRDIKPGNIMISAEGLSVIVDFGSCSKAKIAVRTRQQALALSDYAQQHCTLPYRAPELLDVTSNTVITEKSDIWSLGCVLFACCFGYSPFEKAEIEYGANLNLAISQGNYTIPEYHDDYSENLIELIKSMIVVDSAKRPSIDEVLEKALASSTN